MELEEIGQEMQGRIVKMMWTTWHYIGDDMIQTCGGRLSRKGVIETVLDCDFCKTHGGDKDAYEILRSLSSTDQERLGKKAFQHPWYT